MYACLAADGERYVSNRRLDGCYAVLIERARVPGHAAVAVPGAPVQRLAPRPAAARGARAAQPFAQLIQDAASIHGVDPALVKAVITVESGFDSEAVSPKGAVGLMQVIPATGLRYGVVARSQEDAARKLLDPAINVHAGVRLLSELKQKFAGDLRLVLAAYNAGEGAVRRYNNQVPPYDETERYVASVIDHYRRLTAQSAAVPAPYRQN